MSSPPFTTSDGLEALHEKAWGKPWPSRKATLNITDDMLDAEAILSNDDNTDDTKQTSRSKEYTCLTDIQYFLKGCKAFHILRDVPDVIVIRDEYITLRKALEADMEIDEDMCFVLTGHPGIGKTIFLIYLLLHRLSLSLPTAFQFHHKSYILFSSLGVTTHSQSSHTKLPKECWLLVASNEFNQKPCEGFMVKGTGIIQTTPSRPEWMKWEKYMLDCEIWVVDVPRRWEVAAIAQESGYSPSDAISLLDKWGPCTRTIMNILERPFRAKRYASWVSSAAMDLGYTPPKNCWAYATLEETDHERAELLFIRPIRDSPMRDRDSESTSDTKSRRGHGLGCQFGRYVPTEHLLELYKERCRHVPKEAMVNLFEMLGADMKEGRLRWREKRMHVAVTQGEEALRIVREGAEVEEMKPTTRILPMSEEALIRERGRREPFYWIPPSEDFEGVDGVLADTQNIFVLQATFASDTHRTPQDGIRKVWRLLGQNSDQGRLWHFIAVVESEERMKDHVDGFGRELAELRPGKDEVPVEVWGCVLPKDG